MKDLGFNEFGELANGGADEENARINQTTEMTSVNKSRENDPDGDEEADDTNIAIWIK